MFARYRAVSGRCPSQVCDQAHANLVCRMGSVVSTLGGTIEDIAPDSTLGGYMAKHGRPPAFEGSDGAYYSVDLYLAEQSADDDLNHRFGGALLFVRWSEDGTQPVGHLETPYLCQADNRADVRSYLQALSLHDVKEHLEQLVEQQKSLPDW